MICAPIVAHKTHDTKFASVNRQIHSRTTKNNDNYKLQTFSSVMCRPEPQILIEQVLSEGHATKPMSLLQGQTSTLNPAKKVRSNAKVYSYDLTTKVCSEEVDEKTAL